MLDVRNSALGIKEHENRSSSPLENNDEGKVMDTESELPVHLIRPIDLSTDKATISLQDMISTTVALKSNMDVEITKPVSQWPHTLFLMPQPPAEEEGRLLSLDTGEIPSHIIQVISGLQREILLLRNELNFELWLSRENVKHIGRLYQDRILAKTAETERQGLVCYFVWCS